MHCKILINFLFFKYLCSLTELYRTISPCFLNKVIFYLFTTTCIQYKKAIKISKKKKKTVFYEIKLWNWYVHTKLCTNFVFFYLNWSNLLTLKFWKQFSKLLTQKHTHTTLLLLLKKKNKDEVLVIFARSKKKIKDLKKN